MSVSALSSKNSDEQIVEKRMNKTIITKQYRLQMQLQKDFKLCRIGNIRNYHSIYDAPCTHKHQAFLPYCICIRATTYSKSRGALSIVTLDCLRIAFRRVFLYSCMCSCLAFAHVEYKMQIISSIFSPLCSSSLFLLFCSSLANKYILYAMKVLNFFHYSFFYDM